MTPERWQQVRDELSAALALAPRDRSAYLEGLGANDPALRSEVMSLLAIEQQASPEFLCPPTDGDEVTLNGSGTESSRLGRRIGPYQLVEEIGIGGMGVVYRAFRADDQFRKEVAIKLVRSGENSSFVVSRFKSERQLLAGLDHPNIAALFDGGTTEEGVPYFAMELIAGQPIVEYCNTKKLSVRERLELFLHVCSAVQYAHQRLIIHRDLKPSNILVTSTGTPKLLDFGIAKILEAPSLPEQGAETTISLFRLLTPAYASPEQIRGETITTASDVYSLGVVLYELLTGHRPCRIESNAPYEIEQAVCEFEPEKPSAIVFQRTTLKTDSRIVDITPKSVSEVREGSPEKLSRLVRGDLDNIILMALRKEPQRRYPSVEQFAADLVRHLENKPVSAAKDTLQYRLSKFVSRHKAGFAAAIVVAVSVIGGIAVTLHEARIAQAQRWLAEQRFNDVRDLANSLLFDVHDSIQDLPGSTPARKLLIERALRYLDGLARGSASEPSLQRELATAYEKVGTVQGNPFGANLGDVQGALASYGKALAIREHLTQIDPENVADQVALARSQRLFAATSANRSVGWDEKRNMEEELLALATAEKAYHLDSSNPAALEELQTNYDLLVTFRDSTGDYEGAWEYLQKEKPIIAARLQTARENLNLLLAQGKWETKAGVELAKLGFREEAFKHFHQGIQIFESLSAGGADTISARYLAAALERFGDAQLLNSNVREALHSYQRGRQVLGPLLETDPKNAVAQLDMASALARIGNAEALNGNTKVGVTTLDQAARMLRSQIARDPDYNEPPWLLVLTLIWNGEALERNGHPEAALGKYREVIAIWEQNKHPLAQTILAGVHEKISGALASSGRWQEASQEADLAETDAEQMIATHPYMLNAIYVKADANEKLGELHQRQANQTVTPEQRLRAWTEARNSYKRSLDAWAKLTNPAARTPAGFSCGNPKKITLELAGAEVALRRTVQYPFAHRVF